jgi:hypothetical protein
MRKSFITTFVTLSLGLLAPAWTNAGTILCDFTGDPSTNGFKLSDSAVWMATGGNTGGFVQLTDAIDSEVGTILLPDFDAGKIISGFTVSMDVRVGNGTDALPGEGWSINFVPATAEVISSDGTSGWASDFVPTANQPCRGSAEGLGVYALTYDHGGGDILGFNLRYNQVEFITGGWTLPTSGAKVYNGACSDTNSLQTGPIGNLCWANFTMTNNNGVFDIYWKGSPIVRGFATGWTPQAGRWILSAQTSTSGNEVHEFDNISITTTLASKPVIASFNGGPTGFGYDIQDLPGATVNTATIQLTLDGAAVTNSLVNKTGTNTVATYNSLLPAGTHTATISFNTTLGVNVTSTNKFTIAAYTYTAVPTNYAVTGVNTSLTGFKVHPYETIAPSPNDLAWSEAQLAGLYGPNIADLSQADAQGFFSQADYINYNINSIPIGHFITPDYNEYPAPGIPGIIPGDGNTTGNFTEEILTWLYFPSAGAYTMGVNSDDGFKVTTSAKNVADPNGLLLGQYNLGRGAADTFFYFTIQAPGYYPFRLLWENGNGELPGNLSSCEWFIQREDGTLILLDDTTKPGVIRSYRSGPGGLPYVQTFSGTVQGFTYVLVDGASSVALPSVHTSLNGGPVTTVPTSANGVTTLAYTAPALLPSPSTNVVVLSFADNSATPVTQTVTNTFVVSEAIVPPGIALSTGVDTSKPGFQIRTYETTNVQPNAIWWTEMQLAGMEGPNIAPDLSSSVNGWWTNTDIVNYDAATGTSTGVNGHFNLDNAGHYLDYQFPGQDPNLTTFDNASAEIVTWVNFPAAGTYTMGVDSDDGFKLTLGANPRDMFSTLLGQYDGGRGVTDSIFSFYIPQAGFYPMRLVWENGNGGCNLEWFSVQADGSYVAINDALTPGSLMAYAVGPAYPTKAFVSLLKPGQQEGQQDKVISANTGVFIEFTDGSTQVDPNSIKVWIDGQSRAVTASKVGGITTANAAGGLIPSGETAAAVLVYSEIGNATPITNTWTFTVNTYNSLPAALANPLGSGIASKPGFRLRVAQLPIGFNSTELNPSAEAIEQVLAGLWGTGQALSSSNVVDMTPFTDNGYYDLTSIVNFSGGNNGTELGYFQTGNGYPDAAVPGLPGTTGYIDQFATEFLTYVEFPTIGLYTMGVSSDDCFRVYPTNKPPALIGATLYVKAPSAIAGKILPGDPAWTAGGWGGTVTPAWPNPPITARVVYTSSLGNDPPAPLPDAADIAGNICMIDRGGIEFGAKAVCAQLSGAIGCIIVNNRQDLPISMGSGVNGYLATIPVMMIHQNDGDILKAHLSDPGGVSVTVGWDPELILGEYDNQGGRGTAETAFSFGVTQPGVYPLRLVWNNGGGGLSCEWYSIDASGNRTLINDSVAGALKAYRDVAVLSPPSLSIAHVGANVVLTFEGTLQSAPTVTGTYADMGVTSPYTNAPSGTKFFRAHR